MGIFGIIIIIVGLILAFVFKNEYDKYNNRNPWRKIDSIYCRSWLWEKYIDKKLKKIEEIIYKIINNEKIYFKNFIIYNFISCTDDDCNNITNVEIGDFYQGGVVIHIYQPGENGYVNGEIHGIISSTVDQTFNSTSTYYPGETGCMWQPGTYDASAQTTHFNLTNSSSTALGTGGQNTNMILAVAQQTGLPFPAATLAEQYNAGGFNDWSLPSKEELQKQYEKKFNRRIFNGCTGHQQKKYLLRRSIKF